MPLRPFVGLLALAMALGPAVLVQADASPLVASYVGASGLCRLVVQVTDEDPADATREIHVFTDGPGIAHAVGAPECGTAYPHVVCFEAIGSFEGGFECVHDHGPRLSVGGARETAPGMHAVTIDYYDERIEAVATSTA